MKPRTSQVMAYILICCTTVFAIIYIGCLARALQTTEFTILTLALLLFKTTVEILCSFYGFSFLFTSIAYFFMREREPVIEGISEYPPVGIIYLCCNDFDSTALRSLASLQYPGKLHLIVHDDSNLAKGVPQESTP